MFHFKARAELRRIIRELDNFLANNYKDAAHEQRLLLMEKSRLYYEAGKLSRKQYLYYCKLYTNYTEKMKDYHH